MLTIQKKSLRVGKYVNTDHVDQVIRTYKQERWVHNSQRLGKEDSLSVWYSVEELEEFIEKIKQYGANGLRFYFGAYPSEFDEKPEYAGRQTIVMVATKSKETEKGTVDKDIYLAKGCKTDILAYNTGRVCPPMCKPLFDPDGDIGITIVDQGEKGLALV